MKTSSQPLIFLVSLLIIASAVNLAFAQDIEDWEDNDTILVGRISHLEGQMSRYTPDTDDWESTSKEAPIGMGDQLYSEPNARAEFIMPNNTWIRIGGDTQFQLVDLVPLATKIDIAFGKARFYNKSARTKLHATTPFGRISAPPGTVFDLTVDRDGVEIIAIKNNVAFVHNASSSKHEIRSDASAIFADLYKVTTTTGEVAYSWKKWNREMDNLWASRMRTKGKSTEHLPAELHTEAYPLDNHGVWERVYYEGSHYRFWRPVHVHVGWAPFTSGVWSVWHGEHVWVPHEPFGYVTHHYGNWVFTAGFWYWAPPVTRVMVRTRHAYLKIGFGWYPGRVAWIHHGAHLGWIPLAPHEPYYTHRRWGRRSIVVSKSPRYRHRPHRYRHHKHAVVIHRSHLYRSTNYRKARIKSIQRTDIRKNFRSSPVLSAAVLKDRKSAMSVKNRHRLNQRRHYSPRSDKNINARERKRLGRTPQRQSDHRKGNNRHIRSGKTNPQRENKFENRKRRHNRVGPVKPKNRKNSVVVTKPDRRNRVNHLTPRNGVRPRSEVKKRNATKKKEKMQRNRPVRNEQRRETVINSNQNKSRPRYKREIPQRKQSGVANAPSHSRQQSNVNNRRSNERRNNYSSTGNRRQPSGYRKPGRSGSRISGNTNRHTVSGGARHRNRN